MPNVHREARIYFTVGLLFALDQLFKWLALQLTESGFSIVSSVLRFELHLNPGFLFVLPLPNLFVIIVTAAILVVMMVLIIRSDQADNEPAVWQYTLIFAGGLSNLIDRFRVGATIDYLTVSPSLIPYFNIGDVMIAVGLILLLLSLARTRPALAG